MANMKEQYEKIGKDLYVLYNQLMELNNNASVEVVEAKNCTQIAEIIDELVAMEGSVKIIDKEIKMMKSHLCKEVLTVAYTNDIK